MNEALKPLDLLTDENQAETELPTGGDVFDETEAVNATILSIFE